MSDNTEGRVSLMVSPEDGDGETYYYEVTRHGEVWDGRTEASEGEAVAKFNADALLRALVDYQNLTGRNHEGPI
jgi:hypothetical protein